MNPTDQSALLLQIFIDALPDCGICLLDVDGTILSCNEGTRRSLGYADGEIVGRPFSILSTAEDRAAGVPLRAFAAALAEGRHEETAQRVRKDGTEFNAHAVLTPIYGPARKLMGFGSLIRDLTPAVRAVAAVVPQQAKILVVEDDDLVRKVAIDQLTRLGYDVVAASSGPEALDILAQRSDIDLLFTDVVMPGGLNGGEVAEKARRIRPGLKVLFASGYFEGALVRNGSIEASAQFLVKPYRKSELAEKVEEVLGARASAS